MRDFNRTGTPGPDGTFHRSLRPSASVIARTSVNRCAQIVICGRCDTTIQLVRALGGLLVPDNDDRERQCGYVSSGLGDADERRR